MLKNKQLLVVLALLTSFYSYSQTMSLQAITDSIRARHPAMQMFDQEIRSMDEAARGARSWMAPQFGFGQFMTPYDISRWKKEGNMPGMGSIMISAEQMFPNRKKLDADEQYMRSMSLVGVELKEARLNELIADAKNLYYDWIVLTKKTVILNENEQILQFMIANAELRYRNNLEKLGAYYKAKAALGEVRNMRLMLENEIGVKRIRLNSLMGRNALTDFEIDTAYRWVDYSTTVFDSTLFYNNRSDLKSIDREMLLVHLKQEMERAALKPQFGIRFDNMFGFAGQPVQYSLMGMVRIPMAKWSSKMNKAKIECLKWEAYTLQSQKEMMLNEYSGMAYAMRSELNLKRNQLKLYENEIIPSLRKNFTTLQLGYEQNTEELFMLYDAWERLNMKQLEYVDLISQALAIQVSIDRIIQKQ